MQKGADDKTETQGINQCTQRSHTAQGTGETTSPAGCLLQPWPERVSSLSSHQPQEGGTQHHGGEPAQHVLGTAFPPRCLSFGLILCPGAGREEPLPSGRTELQLQLQRGGSKMLSTCRAPCTRASGVQGGARPRPRVPESPGQTSEPGPARASVSPEQAFPPCQCSAREPPSGWQGACADHVPEMRPLVNQERSSDRKLIWLPWRSDFLVPERSPNKLSQGVLRLGDARQKESAQSGRLHKSWHKTNLRSVLGF
ncbi:uncharacterized protein LOC128118213 [Peromyscus californicus insignis]|uniref:uncharacterized protein LOC128118213 n=1 Tax=Peromyscus californicus insignis TaxID=564181 RepID=UPI0022A6FAB2|nr:uncharacterized protein LOC128118213 [Peromyscus californicus insignis]